MSRAWGLVMAWVLVARAGAAEPAPEWDARFAGRSGWVGGDCAYSVELGPRRVLWLFGDSLFGAVRDGGRPGAVMVNNALGLQAGVGKDTTVRFLAGPAREGKPTAFFTPADGKGWYWPQAGVRAGDRLFVFLAHVERAGDGGAFGFRHVAGALAAVANPDDDPTAWRVKVTRVPFDEFGPARERSWGSAVFAEGDYLYVYGYDEDRGKGIGHRHLTVARVPRGKLDDFTAWRFRTRDGWGERPSDSARLADGLATEFSVCRAPGGKGYVLVYTENGIGDRVVGRFADAPEGPWSASELLYQCPEMRGDKGVFTYAAKAHPWAGGDGLLVSYCTNAHDFARLFKEADVYRPRFVRVKRGEAR